MQQVAHSLPAAPTSGVASEKSKGRWPWVKIPSRRPSLWQGEIFAPCAYFLFFDFLLVVFLVPVDVAAAASLFFT